MKLGIAGLPNVGKTTLFNALTGSNAETSAYAMAGAKPNIGTAKVPDERLDWLAEYYHPKKYTPATIEFVDVAGVNVGTGKSNEVFQSIRQTDALVHVVRCFDNDEIFLEPADAKRDAEAFDLELILADIEIVERRLERAKKNAKSGDKKYKRECEMCEALIAHLTDEKPARSFEFTDEDSDILVDGGLLTVKPVVYAANLDEDGMMNLDTNANFAALKKIADEQGAAQTVQDNLNTHAQNTTAHISATERTAWNAKANAADLTSHVDDAAVHVTATEKAEWNSKVGKSTKVNLTLYASSWSTEKKYTVNNANITATSAVELLPRENNGITQAQMEALSGAMIVGGTQAAGSIQLVALGDKPTTDIPVTLIIRRDS